MADIRPFAAFRPRSDIALRVASPPYDVISSEEARVLAEGNPYSFLHVSRPEIDLPSDVDEHEQSVYDKGRENLEAFIGEGTLKQDEAPHIYVYAQQMGEHRQVGIVACASVADYDKDIIKKHEKTRADKEDDRTKHIDELSAHDEPVFLTYRASKGIDALVAEVMTQTTVYDFSTKDGVQHQLWVASTELSQKIASAFGDVPALYVADGHHRSAAASRVHKARRGDGGEHGFFLAVVFPHDQMNIMAYNRVVRDLDKRSPEALLAAIRERFDVTESGSGKPSGPKRFGLYLGGKWYEAAVKEGSYDAADPVAWLDCSICQDQLLAPIFAVNDPRRDTHIAFVGGIRGAKELEARVDASAREGETSVGIHLYPTQLTELMEVSDAGLLMPPKSTWFEPKLASGLFVHAF